MTVDAVETLEGLCSWRKGEGLQGRAEAVNLLLAVAAEGWLESKRKPLKLSARAAADSSGSSDSKSDQDC